MSGATLTPLQRKSLGVASLIVLAGFGAAGFVQPDPRGFGTHQQFGFPPCTFRSIFGIPCPGCGGTTCVAHFVRGEWPSALRANPAVFALACCSAAFVPWSWASCRRRTCLMIPSPLNTLLVLAVTLASLAFVQWGWRLVCP